jgi:hypothetical protein
MSDNSISNNPISEAEHLRRWRLILGGDEADGTGVSLSGRDGEIDRALALLYGSGDGSGQQGGAAHRHRG